MGIIKKWIVFLVLTVLSLGAEAIVGGEPVKAFDKEALSTVGLSNGCTGVLIGKREVLTAAHCISEGTTAVSFGLNLQTAASVKIEQIKVHEVYKGFSSSDESPENPAGEPVYDIAAILLMSDAPENFKPALIFEDVDLVKGDSLILSGFGLTNPLTNEGFGVLRRVSTVFDFYNRAALEIVFGPTPGQSACKGDSGGPMYVEKEDGDLLLVGLTSRGFASLGPCSGSGNYTDVRAHREWIEETFNGFE